MLSLLISGLQNLSVSDSYKAVLLTRICVKRYREILGDLDLLG